jgi:hypothetical protein
MIYDIVETGLARRFLDDKIASITQKLVSSDPVPLLRNRTRPASAYSAKS